MANRSSKERLIDYYVTRQATHIAEVLAAEGRLMCQCDRVEGHHALTVLRNCV